MIRSRTCGRSRQTAPPPPPPTLTPPANHERGAAGSTSVGWDNREQQKPPECEHRRARNHAPRPRQVTGGAGLSIAVPNASSAITPQPPIQELIGALQLMQRRRILSTAVRERRSERQQSHPPRLPPRQRTESSAALSRVIERLGIDDQRHPACVRRPSCAAFTLNEQEIAHPQPDVGNLRRKRLPGAINRADREPISCRTGTIAAGACGQWSSL